MIRKHVPISERYMNFEYDKNTICQTLRDIYHAVEDPDTKIKIRIAVSMAKAMDRKLKEYNSEYCEDFWDERT